MICIGLTVFSCSPLFYSLTELLPEALGSRVKTYIEGTSYSIMSLLSRTVFLGLIVILYAGPAARYPVPSAYFSTPTFWDL